MLGVGGTIWLWRPVDWIGGHAVSQGKYAVSLTDRQGSNKLVSDSAFIKLKQNESSPVKSTPLVHKSNQMSMHMFQLSTFSFFADSWYDLWLAGKRHRLIGASIKNTRNWWLSEWYMSAGIGWCMVCTASRSGAYVTKKLTIPVVVQRRRRPTTKTGKATCRD